MSDFDEEAERQRLREKYEAEREDREATQHMSELLLKGATMTNSHCGTCGDPIFRYDGQEFCPTCNNQVQDDATADATADQQSTGTAGREDETSASARPGDGRPQSANAEAQDANARPQDATASTTQAGTGVDQTPAAPTASSATPDPRTRTPTADEPSQHRDTASTTDATPGPADAVANVEATVERFAAAAADTDDPARAREYLAVVRDATDTLRTLRGDAR
ncbi:Sjogren's syndrome/scleroderma autoantigen 1 family protein [Halorubellus sp. PRR65]|uniref:Sjogren's syndrome/scleroderma autoantigen 1 family protein n=1 Tax=Halorubellus sp. PRR65 TaxID=3098148 RepID=UPI002B25B2A7|nr:Sjogren's syndrome/scleroderma autoantigen 1 family protein [Halorubellus sp. PRR65]